MVEQHFKMTEVGLIPEDWEVDNVDNIANVMGRVGWKGYTKKDLVPFGPYAIGAKHIDKSNRLDLSEPTCLTYTKYLESPEIMVYTNDLLIVQRGTIGKVVYIGKHIGEATINPSMLIVRSKKMVPPYLYYYFVSKEGQTQILNDTSSTGVPMITQKQVKGFKVPYPPLPEQRAIATALSDADSWIESLEKLLAKKRLIKQGAMQRLLTPGEDWEVRKLGEVCKVIGGGTPSTFTDSFWNGDINWFTPTEVGYEKYLNQSRRKITTSGLSNSSATILPIGTILLTSRAGIGDLGILMIEAATNQGFQSLVCTNETNNEFLYYMLLTKKNELLQNASGSTFLEISPNKVKAIEISIPNLKEQIRIATILSDMDAEIESLEKKLQKAKQIKQGMMQLLLTGKVRLVGKEEMAAERV